MLNPLADALGVAFLGDPLRPLGCQATGAQEATHMIRVVEDLETPPDELDDPWAGPQSGVESERLRSLQDVLDQPSALLHGQPGRTPRDRLGLQTLPALAKVGPLPAADRSAVNTYPLGDSVGFDPFFQKLNGTVTAAFQFGRTPLWSHRHLLPQESIGHSLCRSQ